MVQGPNYMKVDVICLRHKPDMPPEGIKIKVTSCTDISMDAFDTHWKMYTERSKFFEHYNVVNDNKQLNGMVQLKKWYDRVLRSQFDHSADRCDKISLIHWKLDIGNKEDFIVNNYIVPFHAMVKTPVMEYWYSHANVGNRFLLAQIGEKRRLPLFDEDEVIRPYYHTKRHCSILDECSTFRNCNNNLATTVRHAVVAERERLAEEVF